MHERNFSFYVILSLLILIGFSNCFLFKQEYSEKLLVEGKIGSGPGELLWETIDYLPTGPTSFGINRRKEIFILDFLNNRVVKFDKNGKYSESFPQLKSIKLMDIAFDKKDNIYIEYVSGDIGIYDADMILKKVLDLKGLVPPITPKITPVEVTNRNTILMVNPKINKENEIIEVDTTGNILKTIDKTDGYILTKGEYYIKGKPGEGESIYNNQNKQMFSIRKLKLEDESPEIVGIDSSLNLYFKTGVKGSMEDRILKVNPGGKILADFNITYSSGHTDVCRTVRVSEDGNVYVLDDQDQKFHLWEYSPIKN